MRSTSNREFRRAHRGLALASALAIAAVTDGFCAAAAYAQATDSSNTAVQETVRDIRDQLYNKLPSTGQQPVAQPPVMQPAAADRDKAAERHHDDNADEISQHGTTTSEKAN